MRHATTLLLLCVVVIVEAESVAAADATELHAERLAKALELPQEDQASIRVLIRQSSQDKQRFAARGAAHRTSVLDDAVEFLQDGEEEGAVRSLSGEAARGEAAPQVVGGLVGEAEGLHASLSSYSSGGAGLKKKAIKTLKEVTANLAHLGKKIGLEVVEDAWTQTQSDRLCTKTHSDLAKVVADAELAQRDAETKASRLRNERAQASIDLRNSLRRERGVVKSLHQAREGGVTRLEAFYAARDKRHHDINVLHATVEHVCTFAAFQGSTACTRHRLQHYNIPLAGTARKQSGRSQSSLRAEHRQAIRSMRGRWTQQRKKDRDDIKKGRAPSDVEPRIPGTSTASLALALLQQKSFATQAKKESRAKLDRLLGQGAGDLAQAPAEAVLLSVASGKTYKTRSVLKLVSINIKTLAKRQRQTAREQATHEAEAAARIAGLEAAQEGETGIQDKLRLSIAAHEVKEQDQSTARGDAVMLRSRGEASLRRNKKTCHQGRLEALLRKQVSGEEMSNVNRLRSLLEVLSPTLAAPDCATLEMASCTAAHQGMCVIKGNPLDKKAECACEKGFAGKACERQLCPGPGKGLFRSTDADACHGNGQCNERLGQCECFANFKHGPKKACEVFKFCPADVTGGRCNGHGRCDSGSGRCHCFAGYSGKDCGQRKCPGGASSLRYAPDESEACSGHGVCQSSNGRCQCHQGFTGLKCQERTCSENCSGQGTCNARNGRCVCNSKFEGDHCQWKRCPGGCGGSAGKCDPFSAKCICNKGFSGPRCWPTRTCDSHDTTYTDWAMYKPGWSRCRHGFLMTGIKKGNCGGLQCLEKARCAKPCWGQKRLKLARCYQANWWDTLNRAGVAKCEEGYFMAGVYRSRCMSLYCLQMGLCCSIDKSRWDKCGVKDWRAETRRMNTWAVVPSTDLGGKKQPVGFMTGLRRAGKSASIKDLNYVEYCGFKRRD